MQCLYLQFVLIFILINPAYIPSQVFEWCEDGYVTGSGGGFYQNIDNSNIDLEINGLYDDYCTIRYDTNLVVTGINSNTPSGIQHEYLFKFSETVDINFKIWDINYGSQWNDRLVFSKQPIIYYQSGVAINGDTVFPAVGGSFLDGVLGVRFENIDSLKILHGVEIGKNPGYIHISEIIINDNALNLSKALKENIRLSQTSNGLILSGLSNCPTKVDIYSYTGQRIEFQHSFNYDQLSISFRNISAGIYLIVVLQEDTKIVRKFSVN